MSENSILIDGKEYISSDRAAKLVGYTKDYVGQLARAGKIRSKRIGRSWYIEEESISKHKLSVHYVLTKPKKTQTKQDSNEKSIKYIDFSHNTNTAGDSKKSYSGNGEVFDGVVYKIENEKDLFPKVFEKQKRDVLLNSDIKYEEVAPSQVICKNNNDNIVKNNDPYVKTVSIRTNFFVAPKKRQNVGIDGIIATPVDNYLKKDRCVVSVHKKTREEESCVKRNKNITIEKNRKNEMVRKQIHYQQAKNGEVSKFIPVIGGIVLFTIFIVLYLLLIK